MLLKYVCLSKSKIEPTLLSISLAEAHGLVRGQESHELRHLDDLEGASSVHVEVSPGLVEIGLQVALKSLALQSLVGSENLLGGSSSTDGVEEESASWGALLHVIVALLLLKSVSLDHRSHEDVVSIGSEVRSDDSLGVTLWVALPRLVPVELELDVLLWLLLVAGVRVRLAIKGREGLGVGSHWRSRVSLLHGVVAVRSLSLRVSLVLVNGSELPGLRVLDGLVELDVGSVGRSGVGSSGGGDAKVLLESLVISVLVDRSELPNLGGVVGGNDAEQSGNSK